MLDFTIWTYRKGKHTYCNLIKLQQKRIDRDENWMYDNIN